MNEILNTIFIGFSFILSIVLILFVPPLIINAALPKEWKNTTGTAILWWALLVLIWFSYIVGMMINEIK